MDWINAIGGLLAVIISIYSLWDGSRRDKMLTSLIEELKRAHQHEVERVDHLIEVLTGLLRRNN